MLRNKRVLMDENDGEGSQGGSGKPTETFSREYVQELRRENKGLRDRLRENEAKVETAEKSAKDAADAATATVDQAKKAADERIVRAELKAEAIKAGIVDVDGLKLVDINGVTLNDKGEIDGADAMIEGLKKAKPYLFTAAASSSTTKAPENEGTKPKNAMEMTPEEHKASLATLLKH